MRLIGVGQYNLKARPQRPRVMIEKPIFISLYVMSDFGLQI